MPHPYENNDPRGWCGDPKRGAAFGRPATHLETPEAKNAYTGALLVSEVLGSSEKFKSSSIFEFIVNLLKSKKAELEKK